MEWFTRVVIGDNQTVSMVEIHGEEPVAREGNDEIIYELPRWLVHIPSKQTISTVDPGAGCYNNNVSSLCSFLQGRGRVVFS